MGCSHNGIRQSACIVFNQITVDSYASVLNCALMGRMSDSLIAPTKTTPFSWFRSKLSCLLLGQPWFICCIDFALDFKLCCSAFQGSPVVMQYILSVESSFLIHHDAYYNFYL